MEKLLEDLKNRLESQDLESISSIMKRIAPEMDTHFACEERALFPAVSPYHPMDLMEAEHESLMSLRESLFKSLRLEAFSEQQWTEQQWFDLKATATRFINEMLDHIGREDAGIFPACERALTADQKQRVIAEMELIRTVAQKDFKTETN